MNQRLLWIETKNIATKVLLLLLLTFLYNWARYTKLGAHPFTGDSALLLPFVSTQSLHGILNGIICLPLVAVFFQPRKFTRSAREEFLMALPIAPRAVAFHRYFLVITLQFFLFSLIKLSGSIASLFVAVPGFKIVDMSFMTFANLEFLTLGIIALYHLLTLFLPKWDIVIGWVFGFAGGITIFYITRQINGWPTPIDNWAQPIAAGSSALVILESYLYLRVKTRSTSKAQNTLVAD